MLYVRCAIKIICIFMLNRKFVLGDIYFADMYQDTKTGFRILSNAFEKWEMR